MADPRFTIEEGPPGAPGLILHVAGELDVATAPRFRARLDRALDAGVREIVIDLSRVTFVDSIALAAVMAARQRLMPDGRLALVACTPFVRLILEASGLDGVLDVFPDCASAKAFAFA